MKIKLLDDNSIKTKLDELSDENISLSSDDRFIDLELSDDELLDVNFQNVEMLNVIASEKIVNQLGEQVDYEYDVIHKPQINGVTLIGNKTSHEIKVQDEMNIITEQDIDNMIYGGAING